MKEVKALTVADPFDQIPFDSFMQSPIGLVPKAGNQTRLIFHLLYDFGTEWKDRSLNFHTPDELCSVKYEGLDAAARKCLKVKSFKIANLHLFYAQDQEGNCHIYLGKSAIKSAFRLLGLKRLCWRWLVMKARHPITNIWQYFVDKCLPFGVIISCALFQRFANSLKHLIQYKIAMDSINNYLDDFLFIAATMIICKYLIQQFLNMCEELGIPIALVKTEWVAIRVIFLGILLDGKFMTMVIPEEKRIHTIDMVRTFLDRKKATVRELQTLCGYLNFLNREIILGRAFTRHMSAKYSKTIYFTSVGLKNTKATKLVKDSKVLDKTFTNTLKAHHHVRLDQEFKLDYETWLKFLMDSNLRRVVNRPMLDIDMESNSNLIKFYSEVSKAETLGFGCIINDQWIFGQWPTGFIKKFDPSIEFLKLHALTVGILTWEDQLANQRITVFCDNMLVVHMVNNSSSSCKMCMKLIRVLTLNGLQFSRRLRARFVRTKSNGIADSLSRLQFNRFRKLAPEMTEFPDNVDSRLWPVDKLFE